MSSTPPLIRLDLLRFMNHLVRVLVASTQAPAAPAAPAWACLQYPQPFVALLADISVVVRDRRREEIYERLVF